MATKRRRTTRKTTATRRRRSTARAAAPTRRRRRRSGMGEMFSRSQAKKGAQATLSGGLGGGMAAVTDRLLPAGWGTGGRVGAMLVESFLLSTVAKSPNMGAGVAGAAGYILATETMYGMSEGGMQPYYYVNPNTMSQPMFLDENGVDYSLSQGSVDYSLSAGGNQRYLPTYLHY